MSVTLTQELVSQFLNYSNMFKKEGLNPKFDHGYNTDVELPLSLEMSHARHVHHKVK